MALQLAHVKQLPTLFLYACIWQKANLLLLLVLFKTGISNLILAVRDVETLAYSLLDSSHELLLAFIPPEE